MLVFKKESVTLKNGQRFQKGMKERKIPFSPGPQKDRKLQKFTTTARMYPCACEVEENGVIMYMPSCTLLVYLIHFGHLPMTANTDEWFNVANIP